MSEEQPDEPEDVFQSELRDLINKHSKENGSNTSDFVLAEYLNQSLAIFDYAVRYRESVNCLPTNNSHSGVETISCAEGHHANCSGTVMNDEEPPCSCTCHQANYRTMIKSIARYNDSKYGLIFEVPYQEDDLLGKEVFIDDELYRVTGVNRMGRMPLGLAVVPVRDGEI